MDNIYTLIAARDAAWDALRLRDIRDNSSDALALRLAYKQADDRVECHPLTIAIQNCYSEMTVASVKALIAACHAPRHGDGAGGTGQ